MQPSRADIRVLNSAATRFVALSLALVAFATPVAARAQDAAAAKPAPILLTFNWPATATLDVKQVVERWTSTSGVADSSRLDHQYRIRLTTRGGGRQLELVSFDDGDGNTSGAAASTNIGGDSVWFPVIEVDSNGAIVATRRFEALEGAANEVLAGGRDSLARSRPGSVRLFDDFSQRLGVRSKLGDVWTFAVEFWIGAELKLETEYETSWDVPLGEKTGISQRVRAKFTAVRRLPCHEGGEPDQCVLLSLTMIPETEAIVAAVGAAFGDSANARQKGALESLSVETVVQLVTEPETLIPHRITILRDGGFSVRYGQDSLIETANRTSQEYVVTWQRAASALIAAVSRGDLAAVDSALRGEASLAVTDDEGASPLVVAARGGHEAVLRRLLDAGAEATSAVRYLLALGDADAARLLRRVARLAAPTPPTLERASEEFAKSGARAAVPLFAEIVAQDPSNKNARAELAQSLFSAGAYERVGRHANEVVAADRCHPRALELLLVLQMLQQSPPALDSAWVLSGRRVACAPTNGEAWLERALIAYTKGDAAPERAALARLKALEYLAPGELDYARWTLGDLPSRAMLIVARLTHVAAIRLVQMDGVRPDVYLGFTGGPPPPADSATRPYAATPDMSDDDRFTWGRAHSAGPFLLVTSADDPIVQPTAAWRRLRSAPSTLRGPLTAARDTAEQGREAELQTEFWRSVLSVPTHAHWPTLAKTEANIAAVDSATTMFADLSAELGWMNAPQLRGFLGRIHVDLADLNASGGHPWRATRHIHQAAEFDPSNWVVWNNGAYFAIVNGDFVAADTLLARGHALEPTLLTMLNRATVARQLGQPDSSLAWLARAERWMASATMGRLDSLGTWTMLDLPRARGDTLAPRRRTNVSTVAERKALIQYNVALAQALRGSLRLADRSLAEASRLADSADLRCYAASVVAATLAFTEPAAAPREWLRRTENSLRNSGCTQPSSDAARPMQ